jgi:hypothetical protein
MDAINGPDSIVNSHSRCVSGDVSVEASNSPKGGLYEMNVAFVKICKYKLKGCHSEGLPLAEESPEMIQT